MTDTTTTKTQLGTHPMSFIRSAPKYFDKPAADSAELFPFTDKASYLAWVKNWKSVLKDIEGQIRFMKAARKPSNPEAEGIHQYDAQYRAYVLGQCAHALLLQRALGKRYSAHLRDQRLEEAA